MIVNMSHMESDKKEKSKQKRHHRHTHLRDKGTNPDADEYRIPLQSFKDVPLTMDFPCVDFIEESHHDEGIEDHGEVLSGGCMHTNVILATVDV